MFNIFQRKPKDHGDAPQAQLESEVDTRLREARSVWLMARMMGYVEKSVVRAMDDAYFHKCVDIINQHEILEPHGFSTATTIKLPEEANSFLSKQNRDKLLEVAFDRFCYGESRFAIAVEDNEKTGAPDMSRGGFDLRSQVVEKPESLSDSIRRILVEASRSLVGAQQHNACDEIGTVLLNLVDGDIELDAVTEWIDREWIREKASDRKVPTKTAVTYKYRTSMLDSKVSAVPVLSIILYNAVMLELSSLTVPNWDSPIDRANIARKVQKALQLRLKDKKYQIFMSLRTRELIQAKSIAEHMLLVPSQQQLALHNAQFHGALKYRINQARRLNRQQGQV